MARDCENGGSYSSVAGNTSLLGCYGASTGEQLPSYKLCVSVYPATQHDISENLNHQCERRKSSVMTEVYSVQFSKYHVLNIA